MSEFDLHGFSADRPIENSEEDLLERRGFSRDLADALSSWLGRDSLVVALHGDWGTGKTSIKNMAVSEIKRMETIQPDIIEFSPWEWAAQEKITASFFKEISSTLGKKDQSKESKKLALALKKYGQYLNTGGIFIYSIPKFFVPSILILLSILGLSFNFIETEWIRNLINTLLVLSVIFAGLLSWSNKILVSLSEAYETRSQESEKTLKELRDELKDLLTEREKPVIVIMDDLDRLTSQQLRMVFQLIKANTVFPNVVFLLLFQRDIVEEKISDGKQSGRDFLEKIIQVPFDIPQIEINKVHDILFKNLNEIIGKSSHAVEMFDSTYWGNIFHGSLRNYFNSLRNVYRFTSTLSFHFSLLNGKKAFEVNPVDLIGIECLRVFEPDVYKEISRSKEIFTKNRSSHDRFSEDPSKDYIQEILKKSSNNEQYVESLLRYLFPTIEWALGGSTYSPSFSKNWSKELRICHPDYFDKYFQFSIPTGKVSNSDLQELIKSSSSVDDFKVKLTSLKQRGLLKNALAQLEPRVEDIPIDNAEYFIKALLDVGDQVDHQTIGFADFSSYIRMVRLVVWFLRRYKNLQKRGEILLKCFEKSDGLSIVEHILQADANRKEKNDSEELLSDVEFEKLKEEFVKKLNDFSKNNPTYLMTNSHLASFLYRWTRWGDKDYVLTWLDTQLESQDGCINFLKAFLSKSSSQVMGDYVAKIENKINLDSIEEFVDIEKIKRSLKNIDVEKLDNDAKEAVIAFKIAIENKDQN